MDKKSHAGTVSGLTDPEQRILQEVSAEELMNYTRDISKEVRLSGSAEEYRAFQFARETLEQFGIQTQLLNCSAYISLPGPAFISMAGEQLPCITHAMAKAVADFRGEVVYIEKEVLEEVDRKTVQDKIILIEGLATPGGVLNAARYGASGAIFINGEYTHEMIVSPVWGNPVPETVPLLPRIPVLSVTTLTGEKIKDNIRSGNFNCTLHAEVDTGFRTIPTLIADIPGKTEPDKFVLFSGHIDSWHYGAMDNGSANAVMLECARILSVFKNQLHRSLRMAFWSGHSHGRYAGSAWYCDKYWEDLTENCVMHVNIDSVGAKGAVVLSEANCMTETRPLAQKSIRDVTGEVFEGARFGRAGDQSFWGTGTPSLFMGLSEQPLTDTPAAKTFSKLFGAGKAGGFGWWWHTTEDTLDKIDPDFLRRDCSIYLLTLYRILSSPLIPVDQLQAVSNLEEILRDYQEKAGSRLDLSISIQRIEILKKKIVQLSYRLTGIQEESKKIRLANERSMQLSAILVPLNYVKNSSFDHDLALKQPPLPKLAEIEELANTDEKSERFYFLRTGLQRRCNEVNFSLKNAISLVEKTIDDLG